ncbi:MULTISPECIES: DUF2281 domain-containing protein [unclassified Pedobacter]|uniref:DUF2281 domain-containing protein n=1 Tax=Pedobacter TaxID=84567 RepID=UPI000B4B7002|nr:MULTISPECIES: DUF2281 domain-containing protein [unclassified Pedobacter]MCX2429333.1 DUF2281 domain-containing protein [Pedobacter sp. GR22-10]MCX2583767.1 DUF2281 domain-containing protein [Pedobacter sp. MR22-3]OWK71022.1 hypothetical protein CBW18_08030 [Pedobacter sp. AJM]
MLATIKGYYEKGKIILEETAPVQSKTDVIVTFLTDEKPQLLKRVPGALKGKISIPDNFNDPLEDLKEYM